MTDLEIVSPNGTAAATEARFNAPTLRRLARLHARAMAAQEMAQQTVQVAQAMQGQFQQALAEACEEMDMPLPRGDADAHIDWRTGAFSFEPAQPR